MKRNENSEIISGYNREQVYERDGVYGGYVGRVNWVSG
jgi:hypothetical protein